MSTGKFTPEKVLNIKEQDGKRILLIQWKSYSVENATWEPESKFTQLQIHPLIQKYEKSKAKDQAKNYALQHAEKIDCGENPFQQTSRHGHFMYGDIPESIESIKRFRNQSGGSEERVTIMCQIKWKDRIETDEQGNQIHVILENSFLDSKMVNEYRPDFLINFYESKVRLHHGAQQIISEE